jgi:hypothetical protein
MPFTRAKSERHSCNEYQKLLHRVSHWSTQSRQRKVLCLKRAALPQPQSFSSSSFFVLGRFPIGTSEPLSDCVRALIPPDNPKSTTRTTTTTRHLSRSVNIFFDFIHTFIRCLGGVRPEFGRRLNREFGELGSSAGDRRGCAVSNKRRGSGSI